MIHLLLLGAATHAILVWSQYFSFALLRSRASMRDRKLQNVRLILANGGALFVVCGVPLRLSPLTVLGATLLISAATWHAASIVKRARRSLPGMFGRTVRFYIVSAGFLALGALLGALMAILGGGAGLGFAHALVNLLGWIGLTVAGTLVTFWPTVLHTRADPQAPREVSRALPVLAGGVLVAATGALLAQPIVLLLGLIAYLAGLTLLGAIGWRTARRSAPKNFSSLSIGFSYLWWFGAITAIVGATAAAMPNGDSAAAADAAIRAVVPYLAAGFAAQVLVGALSYLIPVVLGGGRRPVRVGAAIFNRWGVARALAANASLLVTLLPLSQPWAVAAQIVFLASMSSFFVVLFWGMRAQRRTRQGTPTPTIPPLGGIRPTGT